MKTKYLTILILFLPLFALSQFVSPDEYKENLSTKTKPVLKSASLLLNQYDQKFVHIDIIANNNNVDISGSVKYNLLTKSQPVDTIYFEFSPNFVIDSIKLNSQSVAHYYSNDTILILPAAPIPQGTLFTTQIWYNRIPGAPVNWNSGIKNSYDVTYNKRVTWTLSESFHLEDWLPCKQDLTDKLDSAWIFITVDSSLKAGSEGILTNITDMGNGKRRYEWKTHHSIDYYLLSVAVGDYYEYNIYTQPAGYADSILIQNYIYDTLTCLNNNSGLINYTAALINLFSDKFGLYPYADEKYGHSMCPVNGGMEHQTMTSLGNFGTRLVAHELSHQWFGDKITCASWQDIWINEGFASYAEYVFEQNLFSQASADALMQQYHASAKLEPARSVYIPFNEAWDENRIFNHNLTYRKGSAIIHMLRYLTNNDSVFFSCLKQMIIQYADSVIVGSDVQHIFEAATGNSFQNFFDQYYFGEGYPIYTILWHQDSSVTGFGDLNIKLEQTGSSANNTLFTTPLQIKTSFSLYPDTIVTINPAQSSQDFQFNVNNKKVTGLTLDPYNWVLDSLLSITQVVEIIESDEFFIGICPNPAHEYLHFYYKGPAVFKGEIKLYDLSGRIIMTYSLNSENVNVPLKNINPGIYTAEIKENNFIVLRQKVIIK